MSSGTTHLGVQVKSLFGTKVRALCGKSLSKPVERPGHRINCGACRRKAKRQGI